MFVVLIYSLAFPISLSFWNSSSSYAVLILSLIETLISTVDGRGGGLRNGLDNNS